jgi:uncharacterized protein
MRIIDTHCHYGASKLSPILITEADLVQSMEANGVELSLVMPHAVSDDPRAEHDHVADLCARHPSRFRGIVNLTPLWTEEAYRREAERCVRELKFVALKLNPLQHLTSPAMANADKVFRVANELGVPVIVHTGLGAPWALPALCIPPARKYPDLPIVLAHAGYAVYTAEAQVAASECKNIFLEPSWCPVGEVEHLVRSLGAGRVLFGSDLPENVPVELAKYRAARITAAEREMVLAGTAERLFKLNSNAI